MSGIRVFLEDVLRLRVNAQKSAVARPWERKFLGFSVTAQRESSSADRQAERATTEADECVSCCVQGVVDRCGTPSRSLNPLLRGWINYFQLHESKDVLGGPGRLAAAPAALPAVAAVEATDELARASCVRSGSTRTRSAEQRQRPWSVVERGSVPLHIKPCRLPTSRAWGWSRCCTSSSDSRVFVEPPDAEPHVRWCGRAASVSSPPTRCAPGRAHSLGGASPLRARQGEPLAGPQGCHREVGSEGSRRQNAGPTNRKRIGGITLGEKAKISKPDTCPEGVDVDATGISGKKWCAIPGEISSAALS